MNSKTYSLVLIYQTWKSYRFCGKCYEVIRSSVMRSSGQSVMRSSGQVLWGHQVKVLWGHQVKVLWGHQVKVLWGHQVKVLWDQSVDRYQVLLSKIIFAKLRIEGLKTHFSFI